MRADSNPRQTMYPAQNLSPTLQHEIDLLGWVIAEAVANHEAAKTQAQGKPVALASVRIVLQAQKCRLQLMGIVPPAAARRAKSADDRLEVAPDSPPALEVDAALETADVKPTQTEQTPEVLPPFEPLPPLLPFNHELPQTGPPITPIAHYQNRAQRRAQKRQQKRR